MSGQQQLAFTLTPPPVRRKVTIRAESREAYQAVKLTASRVREQVYAYIAGCGDRGATVDEIVAAWGCSPNRVAPRVTELRRDGRVVVLKRWDGSTVRRKTRQGKGAAVLVVR